MSERCREWCSGYVGAGLVLAGAGRGGYDDDDDEAATVIDAEEEAGVGAKGERV